MDNEMAQVESNTGTVLLVSTAVALTSTVILYYVYNNNINKSNTNKDTKPKRPVTLVDENTKYALPLLEKIEVSHDTRKFRFGLPSANHVLGLPPGQCVYLSAKIDGKLVVRPYTPISSDEDTGYVELMIKVYFKDVNPRFPAGGKMSQHLNNMKIGDCVDFRGPSGHIVYHGNGEFAVRHDKKAPPHKRKFSKISMIAGGSGITPMLQVIFAILRDKSDPTHIRLLFANRSEQDILCRKELEELAAMHSDRFRVWHILSGEVSETWTYSKGHVDHKIITEHLFPPSEDHAVLLCGPPPMVNLACIPNLDKLEHHPNNRLIF